MLAETRTVDDGELEKALFARMRTGDGEAFSEFIADRYDQIFKAAWKWCGNRSDAEDVAQDVCVKLAEAVRTFDGRSSAATWIYRITLNTVRDMMRSSSRRTRRNEGMKLELVGSVPGDQEDAVAGSQLWAAVRKLPERQRDAVLLVYAEDLTHAEAAAVLGCQEATVSVHLHAARKFLRGSL